MTLKGLEPLTQAIQTPHKLELKTLMKRSYTQKSIHFYHQVHHHIANRTILNSANQGRLGSSGTRQMISTKEIQARFIFTYVLKKIAIESLMRGQKQLYEQ